MKFVQNIHKLETRSFRCKSTCSNFAQVAYSGKFWCSNSHFINFINIYFTKNIVSYILLLKLYKHREFLLY